LSLCGDTLALLCERQEFFCCLEALLVQIKQGLLGRLEFFLSICQFRDLRLAELVQKLRSLVNGIFLEGKLVTELVVDFIAFVLLGDKEVFLERVLLLLNLN
jgi:hypothetical protein